jgi:hypothetical protein
MGYLAAGRRRRRLAPPAVVAVAASLLFASSPGLARAGNKRVHLTAKTRGLGKSCRQDGDCQNSAQRCLKTADIDGKPKPVGFCVLPCTPIDELAGKNVRPQQMDATPENVQSTRKVAPPRCPRDFQCRTAGGGVPMDLCMKE